MVKKERVRILKPKSVRASAVVKENPVEKHLIENMIHLQKIHADTAEKFDKLSRQISELLVLFEMAARSFSKQQISPVITERDKEFIEKVDKLLDQNKTIAKGLTLMEERIRERTGMESSQPLSQVAPSVQQFSQFQPSRAMNPSVPAQPQMSQVAPVQSSEEELSSISVNKENKEDGNPTPPVSRPLPRF